MNEKEIDRIYENAVRVRRELHSFPETGFDLPRTVGTVERELKRIGVPYTGKYGKSSVVAQLGRGDRLIALRADMDALPVAEQTGLAYSSQNPGKMHACGHDAHTAVLLGAAEYFKKIEDKLPCRLRFIFQPSEECAESGGKMMVENGAADGADAIISAHCDNRIECGAVGVRAGDYMAACVPLTIVFRGVSAHAAYPEGGADAIAMAHEAYGELKEMIKKEAGSSRYIWSVGKLSGGTAHNVIADRCEMHISFRYYDAELENRARAATRSICGGIAEKYGGSARIDWHISTHAVYNDPAVAGKLAKAAEAIGIPVKKIDGEMCSEDFGWYLTRAGGALFRFGTRNEAEGCTAPLHRGDFKIDERGMKTAMRTFIAYVMNE